MRLLVRKELARGHDAARPAHAAVVGRVGRDRASTSCSSAASPRPRRPTAEARGRGARARAAGARDRRARGPARRPVPVRARPGRRRDRPSSSSTRTAASRRRPEPPAAEPRDSDVPAIALDPTAARRGGRLLEAAFAEASSASRGAASPSARSPSSRGGPSRVLGRPGPVRGARRGRVPRPHRRGPARSAAGCSGAGTRAARGPASSRASSRSGCTCSSRALDGLQDGRARRRLRPHPRCDGSDSASGRMAQRVGRDVPAWGTQRGMQVDDVRAPTARCSPSPASAPGRSCASEGGPARARASRAAARASSVCSAAVAVAPQPPEPASDAAALRRLADAALGAPPEPRRPPLPRAAVAARPRRRARLAHRPPGSGARRRLRSVLSG